jgi:hypothetical protein
MAEGPGTTLAALAQLAGVVSVVAGVVLSVWSFNETRQKEAGAARLEAAKPLLKLRQDLYTEMVKTAGILANPDSEKPEDVAAARKRFRELYVAELSMVEAPDVEAEMVAFANKADPDLIRNWSETRKAAYDLAHALRDSFSHAYGVDQR